MNASVGVRELRQQASRLLKRVVAGETIEVTDHGHPVARIVPLHADGLAQLVQDRRATEARSDLLDLADDLGLPAAAAGLRLPSEALTEIRDDDR